jgi:hypothetical protein
VVHVKGPAGETAFIVFRGGVAKHVSGEFGEGDDSLKVIVSWPEMDYRFIEDVLPGEDLFPANVSLRLAASLGEGDVTAAPTAVSDEEKTPALPVLPMGEPAGTSDAKNITDLFDEAAAAGFTGSCAVGAAARRTGVYLFKRGTPVGGIVWKEGRFLRRVEAEAAFDAVLSRDHSGVELFKAEESAVTVQTAGLLGRIAVTRIPAAVLNVEEFVSFAKDSAVTALICIVAEDRAANVLLFEGRLLGTVVAPETALKPELEDALVLHYTPGATVEVFTPVPNPP